MKAIKIIICLCVALWPSTIRGSLTYEEVREKRREKIESVKRNLSVLLTSNEIIHGIFKPAKNGFLGHGGFGVVYRGFLLPPIEREVAMKFTHLIDKENTEKEYETYTYLNAIDNPNMELYGIPTVYYYGTWESFNMMAITLFDSDYNKECDAKHLNNLDILILCKEFVRISKYIHSQGIHHNDVKCAHMMFRRNNGFMIDFNLANQMYNKTILDSSSRATALQHIKNDWKWFLQSVCQQAHVVIHLNCESYVPESEQQIQSYMNILETTKNDGLRKVLVEMGKQIYEIKDPLKMNMENISFYDQVYNVINEEIEKYEGEIPKLVHWLSNQSANEAREEFRKKPIPSISSIEDPTKLTKITYRDVDFDYFDKKIMRLTLKT